MRANGKGIHENCRCSYNDIYVVNVGGIIDDICHALVCTYKGLTTLLSSILCDKKADVEWHQRACFTCECICCGAKTLLVCPVELHTNESISWRNIDYEVVGHTEEGKEKKSTNIEFHETTPKELISYLKLLLKTFIFHNFLARWQDVQFRELLQTMFEGFVISCVDFFESYTMNIQNEIQNMHQHNFQISILVHIS